MIKNIFFKPIFWISFILISAACALLTIHYFPQAHSIIHLNITMNRSQAIEQAHQLVNEHHLVPANGDVAANFKTDYAVQFFVELAAGGKEAFTQMIDQDLYQPYTWQVRFFKEHMPEEVLISFTPTGKPYGFVQKISENNPGAQLSVPDAQKIAQTQAATWGLNLEPYKLIEASKETAPSGRIDHTFVFERPDAKIGDGFYRIRLKVTGDALSELTHFVQVPEAFTRTYQNMRSANDAIHFYANIALMLLYFFGGCILGLLYLMRRRFVLWRAPIIWGIIFMLLSLGSGINQLPLAWMQYNTAISESGFLAQYIISIVLSAIGFGLFFTVVFAAAESLTRAAFGNHLQFWSIWDKGIANSDQVLGRTIAGYLLVPIDLLFGTLFYIIMSTKFGWWNPSSSLFDPNILATYFPWFDPLAVSIRAGFWEECMFRAVPLSCAALIGQRFGKRNWWIAAALILQALIFGAGHANYPAQPAIARVIELFVPSIFWGILYLYFGLLVVIVMHIVYDALLFSIPLFLASGLSAHVSQAMVIGCSLIPLFIVLVRRLQMGGWITAPTWAYNRAWQAPAAPIIEEQEQKIATLSFFSNQTKIGIFTAGAFGLAAWFITAPSHQDAQDMHAQRSAVIATAQDAFIHSQLDQNKIWSELPTAFTNFETNKQIAHQHRFIWQQSNDLYHTLLGTYLQSPIWQVRFAQFAGPIEERALEAWALINHAGNLYRFVIHLPEAQVGAELSEEEARSIARHTLREKFGIEAADLKEFAAKATKRPGRMDWTFTFVDEQTNSAIEKDSLRIDIEISGDQVTDYHRYIHVPEEWDRAETNRDTVNNIIALLCMVLLIAILCAGAFATAINTQNGLPIGITFLVSFIILFGSDIVTLANSYTAIAAQYFNTSQPFHDQAMRFFGSMILKSFFVSAFFAISLAYMFRIMTRTNIQRTISNGFLGVSIGILLAAIEVIAIKCAPSLAPIWADYTALPYWSPFLGTVLATCIGFIKLSTLAMLGVMLIDWITEYGQKRLLAAITLIFLLALAIGGLQFTDNHLLILVYGISLGIGLIGSYYAAIRFDLAMIPLAVAGYMIMEIVQQMRYHALPTSVSAGCVSIGIILALAWIAFRKLNK